jgi:hypothetical protein
LRLTSHQTKATTRFEYFVPVCIVGRDNIMDAMAAVIGFG